MGSQLKSSIPIEANDTAEIVTICGIDYAYDFFRFFSVPHVENEYFRIVKNDGAVVVEKHIIEKQKFDLDYVGNHGFD